MHTIIIYSDYKINTYLLLKECWTKKQHKKVHIISKGKQDTFGNVSLICLHLSIKSYEMFCKLLLLETI